MLKPRILAIAGAALILLAAGAASLLGQDGTGSNALSGAATVVDERTLQIGGDMAHLWGLEPLADAGQARETLATLVADKTVWCTPITPSEHAAMRCFVANENIAVLLLARGEARTPSTLRGGEKDWVRSYKAAEAHAQHAHLGVWHE